MRNSGKMANRSRASLRERPNIQMASRRERSLLGREASTRRPTPNPEQSAQKIAPFAVHAAQLIWPKARLVLHRWTALDIVVEVNELLARQFGAFEDVQDVEGAE